MTFGERLKEIRERRGMTQAAVWEAAGLPRNTYLNYERSLVAERIPFSAVISISKALGVEITAFADCDLGSPAPKPTAPPKPAPAKWQGGDDYSDIPDLPPTPLQPPSRLVGDDYSDID